MDIIRLLNIPSSELPSNPLVYGLPNFNVSQNIEPFQPIMWKISDILDTRHERASNGIKSAILIWHIVTYDPCPNALVHEEDDQTYSKGVEL